MIIGNFLTESGLKPSDIPIATTDTAGIVKPDGNTIIVDSEGTISANAKTPISSSTTVGGIKVDNAKEAMVDENGSFTIDPYYYRLDRRKLFPAGSGLNQVLFGDNVTNNATVTSTVEVVYSGVYFIYAYAFGAETAANPSGTPHLVISDANNTTIAEGYSSYGLVWISNQYIPRTVYTTAYGIAPLQAGTKIKAQYSGIGSSSHACLVNGSLIYGFNQMDTSHWWNSNNTVS